VDASVELVRQLLPTVVNIHARVASAHPSTRILGEERMGSGTIVDPAGLILTVNYVVMGAESIHVALAGQGRRARGEIVAQDFDVGLALLRIRRQGLQAATLASSEEAERGAPVFVLASTAPRERRVSGGVITFVGEFEAYWEYLLERGIVSNAFNPGFGGGPLFTLDGRMIGVVSLNLNEVARHSMAIPVEHYLDNREELLRHGRVVSRPRRAWLGLFAHPLEDGVVVAGVVPQGPAERAGLGEGDLIVALDQEEVTTRKGLYLSLWRHAPGEKVLVEVMRDQEVRRLEVVTGDRADFYKQL
jgi:S1-C subfamily serine protease